MKYVFAQVQNLTFKAHDGFKRLQEAGRPVSRKYLLRTELLKDYKRWNPWKRKMHISLVLLVLWP